MNGPTLVELTSHAPPGARWFTTLEGENPSGSIKDRLVLPELQRMLEQHGDALLSRGVAELSAGSTARALALHCRALSVPFFAFIDAANAALGLELRAMGAQVRALSGGIAEIYAAYDRACAEAGHVPFRQFEDASKRAHYHGFGRALAALLPGVDHVVGAVGTGHSLLGTAAAFPDAKVHSAEPVDFAVAGARNLDRVWFGERDPLFPDRPRLSRVLVDSAARLDVDVVATDRGPMRVGDSFRLVLGAAHEIARTSARPARFLLIGAENRLQR